MVEVLLPAFNAFLSTCFTVCAPLVAGVLAFTLSLIGSCCLGKRMASKANAKKQFKQPGYYFTTQTGNESDSSDSDGEEEEGHEKHD